MAGIAGSGNGVTWYAHAGYWNGTPTPEGDVKSGTYTISRRDVISAGIAGIGASVLSACVKFKPADGPATELDPIVTATVTPPTGTVATGLTVPFSGGQEEAFLYVPAGYQASTPAPLVLMLHGESQNSFAALSLFQPYADAAGLVLLAIDSAQTTWDVLLNGSYGPDVQFLNAALTAIFKIVNVDATRIAVEGFSDGASYALALGHANGNFFSHVIAFSAGLLPGTTPVGRSKYFLAQGTGDLTFSVEGSGDLINANLIAAGYTVDYVRFTGGHEVPDAVVQQAIAWLAT
jgi:phospholipase/carboxylesterase